MIFVFIEIITHPPILGYGHIKFTESELLNTTFEIELFEFALRIELWRSQLGDT